MRYHLKQIYCRPWLLNGLSLKLIESHYENNYGGALRRLNAITEQIESLAFENTVGPISEGHNRTPCFADRGWYNPEGPQGGEFVWPKFPARPRALLGEPWRRGQADPR